MSKSLPKLIRVSTVPQSLKDLLDINSYDESQYIQMLNAKCELDLEQYKASRHNKIQLEKQKTKAMWDLVFEELSKHVDLYKNAKK